MEVLSTTNLVKLIDKKEFIKIALDDNSEIFVVYIVELKAGMSIYLLQIV